MSKYSDKVAKRRQGVMAALNVAVEITEGRATPPPASADIGRQTKPFKIGTAPKPSEGPHPTPKKHDFALADLGDLPEKCADALERAAALLEFAQTCAEKMVKESASAWQTAEPRGIAQFCFAARLRVAPMAERAKQVPTAKET